MRGFDCVLPSAGDLGQVLDDVTLFFIETTSLFAMGRAISD